MQGSDLGVFMMVEELRITTEVELEVSRRRVTRVGYDDFDDLPTTDSWPVVEGLGSEMDVGLRRFLPLASPVNEPEGYRDESRGRRNGGECQVPDGRCVHDHRVLRCPSAVFGSALGTLWPALLPLVDGASAFIRPARMR